MFSLDNLLQIIINPVNVSLPSEFKHCPKKGYMQYIPSLKPLLQYATFNSKYSNVHSVRMKVKDDRIIILV